MVAATTEPAITVVAPTAGVMTTVVVMSAEVVIVVLSRILRPDPHVARVGAAPLGSPAAFGNSAEDDHR
ncbi:hypothetical protein [Nocardia alni]|uniref:hypothetical protein n=1 Tax=Nocardia alni TaxID=2815723 RepID=UPI001C23DB11|nr:hypothetical protein [Nocardia alni]